MKDTGAAFILPTFLFVGTLLALIGVGVWKTVADGWASDAGGSGACAAAGDGGDAGNVDAVEGVCERMRGDDRRRGGVERGDGVRRAESEEGAADADGDYRDSDGAAVRDCVSGEDVPGDADGSGCDRLSELLSMLVTVVFGRGWFYFLTMGSVLLALALSANTAFADFPRLTRAIAMHDYLPHVFILRGRRLLYSHGIYALTGFTAVILILFGGVTDRLIPLYAIGAFLAFTLSQAGHGGALAEDGEASGPTVARVRERRWRGGDRDYDDRGAGGEVHGRGVGDGAAGACADRDHVGGEAALLAGEAGDGGYDAAEPGESAGADCGDSDGAVGPDYGEGDAVRAAAVEGDQGGACALGLMRRAGWMRYGTSM